MRRRRRPRPRPTANCGGASQVAEEGEDRCSDAAAAAAIEGRRRRRGGDAESGAGVLLRPQSRGGARLRASAGPLPQLLLLLLLAGMTAAFVPPFPRPLGRRRLPLPPPSLEEAGGGRGGGRLLFHAAGPKQGGGAGQQREDKMAPLVRACVDNDGGCLDGLKLGWIESHPSPYSCRPPPPPSCAQHTQNTDGPAGDDANGGPAQVVVSLGESAGPWAGAGHV